MSKTFYSERKKANVWIDEQVKELLSRSQERLNIAHITLKATGMFEIGEKFVSNRLDFWVSAFPDVLHRRSGYIVFEEEK
jgi:hypothetical protein